MTHETSTSDWRPTYASLWGETVVRVLSTTYPSAAQHVSSDADDVDVTPTRLHPTFHGSFDWHSAAHMLWSAVRLLDLAGDHLDPAARAGLVALLDERLTHEACAVEVAYLRAHPHFERPYGWAWVAMLAAATASSTMPGAQRWAAATRPLFDAVADLVTDWLPRLAYPVRHGEHSNLAFGLSLVHEAATTLQRDDVTALVQERSRVWFGDDTDYPAGWEPGGSDFLSPALCEADLMGRLLEPQEYAEWLAAFLPHLAEAGDPLLTVPEVLDRTDGKAVHLYGLGLSRAWQLRRLAPVLDDGRRQRIVAATRVQVEHVEQEIVAGDFMSTHWLVSFALLAATA